MTKFAQTTHKTHSLKCTCLKECLTLHIVWEMYCFKKKKKMYC